MKRLGIAFGALFLVAQAAWSDPIKIVAHDQKFGHGRITTIEKLGPVNNQGKPLVKEGGEVAGMVTLCATDWTCGRNFTDERGRRWCLVDGLPIAEKPALLSGWIMQGDSGNLFFLDEGGSLYRHCGDRKVVNPLVKGVVDPLVP